MPAMHCDLSLAFWGILGGKYVGGLNLAIVLPQLLVTIVAGPMLAHSDGSFTPLLSCTVVAALASAAYICGPLANAFF